MGQVPSPETERDNKLIRDYLSKNDDGKWEYTVNQLTKKYARIVDGESEPLSRVRVYQILEKHGIPRSRRKK